MPKIGSRSAFALAVAFALAATPVVAAMIWSLRARPHGQWDAFALWNVRARHLAGPGSWRIVASAEFDPVVPDYPLLVPGAVALAGAVPVAMFFLVATTAVIMFSVARLHSTELSLLAGLVFLTSRTYLWEAAGLCADVPLSFFILAAIVLILFERPALAGLCASLAAWTKNEGIAFLALFLVLGAIFLRRRAFPLALCAASLTLALAVFKLFIADQGYLAAQSPGRALALLADPERYLAIAKQLAIVVFGFGQGFIHPILLMAILACAYKVHAGALKHPSTRFALTALLLLFAGYLGVYLVTPLELRWQLSTSLSRLICHVWPAGLVLSCVFLRRPDATMSS